MGEPRVEGSKKTEGKGNLKVISWGRQIELRELSAGMAKWTQ